MVAITRPDLSFTTTSISVSVVGSQAQWRPVNKMCLMSISMLVFLKQHPTVNPELPISCYTIVRVQYYISNRDIRTVQCLR